MLGWAGAVLQHIREVFVYERRLDDRDEREILVECHAVVSAAFPAVIHPAHETSVANERILHGSLIRPPAFEAFDGGGLKVGLEHLVHCRCSHCFSSLSTNRGKKFYQYTSMEK